MFAVEVIEHEMLQNCLILPKKNGLDSKNKPELAKLVSHWDVEGKGRKHLMSILRKTRLTKILNRDARRKEFLSEFGIRSMSKVYMKKSVSIRN